MLMGMELTTPLALNASLNLSRSFMARFNTVVENVSTYGHPGLEPNSGGDTVYIVT